MSSSSRKAGSGGRAFGNIHFPLVVQLAVNKAKQEAAAREAQQQQQPQAQHDASDDSAPQPGLAGRRESVRMPSQLARRASIRFAREFVDRMPLDSLSGESAAAAASSASGASDASASTPPAAAPAATAASGAVAATAAAPRGGNTGGTHGKLWAFLHKQIGAILYQAHQDADEIKEMLSDDKLNDELERSDSSQDTDHDADDIDDGIDADLDRELARMSEAHALTQDTATAGDTGEQSPAMAGTQAATQALPTLDADEQLSPPSPVATMQVQHIGATPRTPTAYSGEHFGPLGVLNVSSDANSAAGDAAAARGGLASAPTGTAGSSNVQLLGPSSGILRRRESHVQGSRRQSVAFSRTDTGLTLTERQSNASLTESEGSNADDRDRGRTIDARELDIRRRSQRRLSRVLLPLVELGGPMALLDLQARIEEHAQSTSDGVLLGAAEASRGAVRALSSGASRRQSTVSFRSGLAALASSAQLVVTPGATDIEAGDAALGGRNGTSTSNSSTLRVATASTRATTAAAAAAGVSSTRARTVAPESPSTSSSATTSSVTRIVAVPVPVASAEHDGNTQPPQRIRSMMSSGTATMTEVDPDADDADADVNDLPSPPSSLSIGAGDAPPSSHGALAPLATSVLPSNTAATGTVTVGQVLVPSPTTLPPLSPPAPSPSSSPPPPPQQPPAGSLRLEGKMRSLNVDGDDSGGAPQPHGGPARVSAFAAATPPSSQPNTVEFTLQPGSALTVIHVPPVMPAAATLAVVPTGAGDERIDSGDRPLSQVTPYPLDSERYSTASGALVLTAVHSDSTLRRGDSGVPSMRAAAYLHPGTRGSDSGALAAGSGSASAAATAPAAVASFVVPSSTAASSSSATTPAPSPSRPYAAVSSLGASAAGAAPAAGPVAQSRESHVPPATGSRADAKKDGGAGCSCALL